jgi:hypothetical protein
MKKLWNKIDLAYSRWMFQCTIDAMERRGYSRDTRDKIKWALFNEMYGWSKIRKYLHFIHLLWSLRGPVHQLEISEKLMQIVEMYRLLLIWKRQ